MKHFASSFGSSLRKDVLLLPWTEHLAVLRVYRGNYDDLNILFLPTTPSTNDQSNICCLFLGKGNKWIKYLVLQKWKKKKRNMQLFEPEQEMVISIHTSKVWGIQNHRASFSHAMTSLFVQCLPPRIAYSPTNRSCRNDATPQTHKNALSVGIQLSQQVYRRIVITNYLKWLLAPWITEVVLTFFSNPGINFQQQVDHLINQMVC